MAMRRMKIDGGGHCGDIALADGVITVSATSLFFVPFVHVGRRVGR